MFTGIVEAVGVVATVEPGSGLSRLSIDAPEVIPLRVWDLRALSDSELAALPGKLNEVTDRNDWEEFSSIIPNLDQANLWLRLDEIEGVVEWHERFWPVSPPDRPIVGF